MKNNYSQGLRNIGSSEKLIWIIILVGVTLRLIRYLYNPSLWFDESVYALDIVNRSYAEFILPSSDWSSKPPYGFLILEKLAIQAFGNSEYSFRLFPLIFGISSLFLFAHVAKNYLKPAAVPVALGLFAILDPLIFQSSNLKPYSGDLAFALLIYVGAIYIQKRSIGLGQIMVMGVVGAVIIWFSHPSVFVLSGVGASLTIVYLRQRDWASVWKLSTAVIFWAASFGAFYFLYTRNLIENIGFSSDLMLQYEQAYIPFPPRSLADIKWIIDSFFELFSDPVGLSFTGIAALTFLIGCFSYYTRSKDNSIILLSPILFTFLAALLDKYPFKGRLIIFLVPFVLLYIAEGVDYLRDKTNSQSRVPGFLLLGLLFIYPLSWAAYHVKTPVAHEEIRPALSYIQDNWKTGDAVYVYYYAQYAFDYYTHHHPARYAIPENDTIIGIAPRGWYRTWRKDQVFRYYDEESTKLQSSAEILEEYVNDMHKLIGQDRVWFLFSAKIFKDGMQEEKFFLYHLDMTGKRLESFGRSGVSTVYLYDLSANLSDKKELL